MTEPKRSVGRPRKADARDRLVAIRLTSSEFAAIEQRIDELIVWGGPANVSEWVRDAIRSALQK